MASLIIGSVFLISEKVKDRKEAKREAKRQAYEKRYQELEEEHKKTKRSSVQNLEKMPTGQSESTRGPSSELERRRSHESLKNEDGPSQWVNDVVLERTKSQSGPQ